MELYLYSPHIPSSRGQGRIYSIYIYIYIHVLVYKYIYTYILIHITQNISFRPPTLAGKITLAPNQLCQSLITNCRLTSKYLNPLNLDFNLIFVKIIVI